MGPPVAALPILFRIQARTPDVWLAASIAGGAVAALAAVNRGHGSVDGGLVAAAVLVGAVSQMAAGPAVALPGSDHCRPAAWLTRVWWPLAGACLAALAVRQAGGASAGWALGAIVGASAMATAAVATASARRGMPETDATSAAVMTAAAAAAGASVCGGLARALPTAFGVWTVAAFGTWALTGAMAPFGSVLGGHVERPAYAAVWLARASGRAALMTIAMATALAGMAVWFFLDPSRAAWYPILATTLFVCLAVPQATSLPAGGRAGMIGRSAAGADGGWRSPAARWARAVATTHAVVLGWPALVALGLHGGGGFARGGPAACAVATLVVLAVAAGVLTLLACLAAWCGLRPQAVRAIGFAVATALGFAAFASLPRLPALFVLPS